MQDQTEVIRIANEWELHHKPSNLADSGKNIRLMQEWLAQNKGGVISVENLNQAVAALRNQLDWYAQPVAPAASAVESNPVDGLPWPNDRLLKDIRTLEDIEALTPQQVRRFISPTDVSTHQAAEVTQHFNDRVSYIKTHRLHAAPKTKEVSGGKPNKVREVIAKYGPNSPEAAQAALKDLHDQSDLRDALTAIRSFRDNRGHAVTLSRQSLLMEDYNKMIARGTEASTILKTIKTTIHGWGDTTIR